MGTTRTPTPPIGDFRQVDGRWLFVDERGSGSPRVVFLPGAGLTGLDYLHLHECVAKARSSLLYDRAGTGWSESVALPRASLAVTDELHELLATTDEQVVLVGHSLGGLYARHYATRFGPEVAGLVLLDPAHEDYDEHMPDELTALRSNTKVYDLMNAVLDAALKTAPTKALLEHLPPVRRYQALYRDLFDQELPALPSGVRARLIERHVSVDWLAVGLRESRALERLYAEVRAAGPVPDVPLVIVASTGSDGFRDAVSSGESPELLQAEIDAKLRLYDCIAASASRGEVRHVDAGHVTLPFRHPDAVIDAIHDVAS